MPTDFEPDDEDAFFEFRDDLIARFERSPGNDGLGWVAGQVLDFKWGYLNGDMSHWTVGDIEEILLGLFPAKVMMDPEDPNTIVAGFAALLHFLADEGVLAKDDARDLGTAVFRLAPRFRVAAFDERNWSMGKRLWGQASAEGVDFSDPTAMQQFVEDFNQRTFAERDAVLGSPPGPDPGIPRLPQVELPPTQELEQAARDTIWFERLHRLAEYVGQGRPLTARGNLKLADGKELITILETDDRFDEMIGDRVFKTMSTTELRRVDLTFRVALDAGFLAVDRNKVVLGPYVELLEEPLTALYGAWLALFTGIGPTQFWYAEDRYHFGWYAEELDTSLPSLMIELHLRGPYSIDLAVEEMWNHLEIVFDLSDAPATNIELDQRSVDRSLRRAFDLLAEMGVVRVEDVTETANEYGTTDRSGGTIDLTPLGHWTTQRLMSSVSPNLMAGAFLDLTAAELLVAASDIPGTEADMEIEAWIFHRGETALTELVDALPGADETGRGLAFQALLRYGPAADEAISRLADDPELWPYATAWGIDVLTGDPADMDCAGDPERFVRLLGAVVDLYGPRPAAAAWAGPAAGAVGLLPMLDSVWRVKLPQTESVLAALGAEHPDKVVAKAARKSLFKYRTAQ